MSYATKSLQRLERLRKSRGIKGVVAFFPLHTGSTSRYSLVGDDAIVTFLGSSAETARRSLREFASDKTTGAER